MSDVFQAAVDTTLNEGATQSTSPEGNNTNQDSSNQQTQAEPQGVSKETALAIAELDKMDKFKLDGQEWTLKDLKAAIMRQKDYTQKTQTLAEERKALEEEKKFRENLAWDLMKMRENPALAQEFVKVYPQSFHKYAEEFLKTSTSKGEPEKNVQTQPQVDVQTLSRLERLEKFYHDQEVSKNEQAIEQVIEKFSKNYPDAANFKETVLARAYESHMQGVQLTDDVWESIFKQVDQEMSELLKAKYGNLVKQQKEANAKASDVGAGGGIAGRAPVKFSKIDDLIKHGEAIARGG